jgi:hypothetical protein
MISSKVNPAALGLRSARISIPDSDQKADQLERGVILFAQRIDFDLDPTVGHVFGLGHALLPSEGTPALLCGAENPSGRYAAPVDFAPPTRPTSAAAK